MCKHIHAVITSTQPRQNKKKSKSTEKLQLPLLQALKNQAKSTNLQVVKQRILNKLLSLTTQVRQCSSVEGLLTAEKHILSAKNSCRMVHLATQKFPIRKIEPANKRITPQNVRPFTSTKNKTKRPTIKLAKPTHKDKQILRTALFDDKSLYESEQLTTDTVTSSKDRQTISS